MGDILVLGSFGMCGVKQHPEKRPSVAEAKVAGHAVAGLTPLLSEKRGAVFLHVRREPCQTEAQAAIVFLGLPSALHSVIGLPKVQQTAVCRSGVSRRRECGCSGVDIRQNGLSPGRKVRDRRRRGSREANGAEAVPVHYLGKTSRGASKGGEWESNAENVVVATEGDPVLDQDESATFLARARSGLVSRWTLDPVLVG
ncbi:hypothetical protein MTO96_036789 [Rhipicephalus appendiculatus]